MFKKFAVIGHPIGHTMSPFIHNRMFLLNKLTAGYEIIDTNKGDLSASLDSLRLLDGFNVTIPHKQNIIPFLDEIDSSAEMYGAVNTVVVKNGKMTGYNTDGYGFIGALSLAGISLFGRVLICGNGGAARTIAIECANAGCKLTLAVRNTESEKALALFNEIKERFPVKIEIAQINQAHGIYDLAVNATPLGMFPKIDGSPLTEKQLLNISAVFDAVYNPTETLLLKTASTLGLDTVNGMGMLVLQAAKAQNIWYGAEFNDNDLLKLIEDAGEETERVFSK